MTMVDMVGVNVVRPSFSMLRMVYVFPLDSTTSLHKFICAWYRLPYLIDGPVTAM